MKKFQMPFLKNIVNPQSEMLLEGFFQNDLDMYLRKIDIHTNKIKTSDCVLEDKMVLELKELNDFIVQRLEDVSNKINDKKIVGELGKFFRETRPDIYYQSDIVSKGYKKERGTPGDFEMMVYVYENQIRSKSKVGQYWDNYFVNNAYAEAVRGRKDKMVEILKGITNDFNGNNIDVLNLPCGPSRDVMDFASCEGLREDLHINFTCVDQDKGALQYSEKKIANLPANISAVFKEGNILNYIRHGDRYTKELGCFDLVYSIGIADYLPDKLLKNMIKFCWGLLRPSGKIIFAFKIHDRDPFAPLPPKWFCDWQFVPRDIDEARGIILGSGIHQIESEEWERSGRIVFLTAVKEK